MIQGTFFVGIYLMKKRSFYLLPAEVIFLKRSSTLSWVTWVPIKDDVDGLSVIILLDVLCDKLDWTSVDKARGGCGEGSSMEKLDSFESSDCLCGSLISADIWFLWVAGPDCTWKSVTRV